MKEKLKPCKYRFYLIFESPARGFSPHYSTSGRAPRTTMKPPRLKATEVAMKFEVFLPAGLFQRPALSAKLTVPEGAAQQEITPEIQDNLADAIREYTGLDVRLQVESPGDSEE